MNGFLSLRIVSMAVLAVAFGAVALAGAFKPTADVKRAEVPAEYKWRLDDIFKDVGEWEKVYKSVQNQIPMIGLCKGKLGVNPKQTLDCLNTYTNLRKTMDSLDAYSFQWWSVDMNLAEAQALKERATNLRSKLEQEASFIEPELQKVSATDWDRMVQSEKDLSVYNLWFRDLKRRQAHILDADRENMLAGILPMREGPYNVMNALSDSIPFPKIKDEEGKDVQLAFSTFPRYRASKNRDVRKEAVTRFFGTLVEYDDVYASSLATHVKGTSFEAKSRGYKSALDMSVDWDAVPVSVYENLINTTGEWMPKTLHRYVGMRKKILNLPEIHYYDLYSPLFDEKQSNFDYETSVKLVADALVPMGQDYLTILTDGMRPGSGWIDVYPNDGKKSGAYCNAAYGFHPFVLLNHMDDLDDTFTLAHEMGHAMHFFLSQQQQPYPLADAPIFLAEVASTFQEEMLLNDLLSKATTKEERLILLNKRVENIRLTITRQTMFAEFEMLIYREVESGGALTAERLNEIYGGLIRKYFGPGFSMDANDVVEWAYIPHFYYNFYVYKYSTGLMAAIVYSQRIAQKVPGSVEGFKKFLAAGGSDYPLAILKSSGIDFTSPEIVAETYKLFEKTLDEIDQLLAQ